MLWLSPAMAGDQTLPGATVESVVAIAKRLNLTFGAPALDFDAAVHKLGTAGVLADPSLVLEAWDVNSLGEGQRRFDNARNGFQPGSTDLFFVFEAERRLRAVQLDLSKLKVELQTKYAEMERLAGGSL
jgi:hypothetical protein